MLTSYLAPWHHAHSTLCYTHCRPWYIQHATCMYPCTVTPCAQHHLFYTLQAHAAVSFCTFRAASHLPQASCLKPASISAAITFPKQLAFIAFNFLRPFRLLAITSQASRLIPASVSAVVAVLFQLAFLLHLIFCALSGYPLPPSKPPPPHSITQAFLLHLIVCALSGCPLPPSKPPPPHSITQAPSLCPVPHQTRPQPLPWLTRYYLRPPHHASPFCTKKVQQQQQQQ